MPTLNGKNFFQMGSTDTGKTIEVLRKSFAAYGLPEKILTDIGPQFTSKEFCDFVRYYDIRHIKSAPYYPATNGVVERFIQTFKHAMKSNADRTLSYWLASFCKHTEQPLMLPQMRYRQRYF